VPAFADEPPAVQPAEDMTVAVELTDAEMDGISADFRVITAEDLVRRIPQEGK
jgi:hypothetical protein